MSQKKTALVVCPGRGSYNRAELGYIQQHMTANSPFLSQLTGFDALRSELGLPTVTELDTASNFSSGLHLKAENAAALIFAAGLADFSRINRDKFDIVAVTGNSMGWYTALGCAGVWQGPDSMQLVTAMAQLTASAAGAQFIYPLINSDWQPDLDKQAQLAEQLYRHQGALFMSIAYGGYAVLAGTQSAVQQAMQALPPCDDRFPLLLPGHAAFHSPLMQPAADQALTRFGEQSFAVPQLPLVDGRGVIWHRQLAQSAALKTYTLNQQVCDTFYFNRAVQVAVKEFAPEHIILLGPGNGLGSAVAQSLIGINWQGLASKQDFSVTQQTALPYVLSMGLPEQRQLVV
ncbi:MULTISPECIES: malonyl CoA-ACP transacylase [unclassified Arsukibacterium]|uniref:malonyl CoA-ACP transacylase n=1 Tax=unclassified Arsukibacterium TaxID=2635278 RepID=UPI000C3C523A|nr:MULTISPECIES: malonyl CoA-ACP transacylase [unclassified Arsukibacterium]MAA96227.1 malonyl CoA-ACP transacylase [Rheinheimera sp.]MBM34885.1 malonyl CoA-ACP transacylase [Rheinheimera sp.]HAW94597.1 malonyl CoA-ACP transacylase [Candidatus Azambacteria bacterium]|tara:strand:- start:29706 stop:30743 length:1038 start_codon:yes stop_codon:yes gene_type:complete